MSLATIFKVLFSIVIASNFVGNSLVISVVSLHRRMQTPMNCLLANLALADLFIGLFFIPRALLNDLYTHPGGLLGDMLCKTLTNANITYPATITSILTLTFSTWERYYAVIYPHSSRGRINIKKLRLLVAATWVIAFSLELIPFTTFKFDEQKKSCFYDWSVTLWKVDIVLWCIVLGLVPLGIEAGLYSRVVYRLWGIKARAVEISQRSLLLQRKRMTKVVLTVTIVNVVLCFPIDIYYFVECFAGKSIAVDAGSWAPVFKLVSHLMLILNASMNPVIYAARDRRFRRHMWRLLKARCTK
ncbi:QRFP-like peptide receptor [Oculina patagonica]